jgi:hypothetical protein
MLTRYSVPREFLGSQQYSDVPTNWNASGSKSTQPPGGLSSRQMTGARKTGIRSGRYANGNGKGKAPQIGQANEIEG